MLKLILAAVLCSSMVYAGPLHASCKLDWSFMMSCDSVEMQLVNQIGAWAGPTNCPNGAGEKCLYTLKTNSTVKVTLIHETPVHHYKDDVSFTFKQGSTADSCMVHGYSTSETWYAHLDYGTNYCNMRNLLEGAQLHTSTGFTQTTSEKICTQFSSTVDCTKY